MSQSNKVIECCSCACLLTGNVLLHQHTRNTTVINYINYTCVYLPFHANMAALSRVYSSRQGIEAKDIWREVDREMAPSWSCAVPDREGSGSLALLLVNRWCWRLSSITLQTKAKRCQVLNKKNVYINQGAHSEIHLIIQFSAGCRSPNHIIINI